MDYDDAEYDFQYDTDDEEPELEVDIENQYYNSKAEIETSPEEVLVVGHPAECAGIGWGGGLLVARARS